MSINKPFFFKNDNNLIEQYKLNLIINLEAKKRLLLTNEMLNKIKKVLTNNEYKRFIKLAEMVTYVELKTLFDDIYKNKCIQKKI